MRALLQRVTSASVVATAGGETLGAIGAGLVALIGIERGDTTRDAEWLVSRVRACRLWDGADGRAWGASASSLGLPILCVSQFTLHADCRKPKPSFSRAAAAVEARTLYETFMDIMISSHGRELVEQGRFQEMMAVSLVNDGPVTCIIDSRRDLGGGSASSAADSVTPQTNDEVHE